MQHTYRFEFGNIMLEPLMEEDIEALRILRNQEKQFFATQYVIDQEGQKKWYQNYLNKDDDIMFKVVKKDAPMYFIGAIALYDIDLDKLTAEFGRTMIDKKLAPEKGIGLAATKAVCLFGFEQLNLKKIIGEVLKTNERIIKVYTRAGLYITGEHSDMYDVEMTRESIRIDG